MARVKSGELASAYLVPGGAEKLPALEKFLAGFSITIRENSDVYVREFRAFGVDDARDLRERATTKAIRGEQRVFISVTPSMTTDAQNALLKTLEEPPANATFFFLVASPQTLLATLRSRSQVLDLVEGKSEYVIEPDEFLAAKPEKRMEMLKVLYEKTDDDERDIRKAVQFLQDMERALAKKSAEDRSASDGKKESVRAGIHAIYRARKYCMDKGAALKPLLEQVALLAPQL